MPRLRRGLLAGIIVVLGALCFFIFSGNETRQDAASTKERGRIKEVTPAKVSKVEAVHQEVKQAKPKDEVISCYTNSDSGVVYERVRRPDGSTLTIQHKPDPLFSNLCDNVIAMIIGSEGGNIPPLPPIDEDRLRESFVQSLLSPVKVEPTDSEKVAAMKLAVREYRKAIVDNIKAGDSRSVLAMIQDHVRDANDKFILKADAIKQINEDCADGDAEFRAEYVRKVNAYLEKYGVSPIETDDSDQPERKAR